MRFTVHPLRFVFEALDAIHFPQGKAANVLRGALGLILEESIFRPKSTAGPSGFADPPRPFVFRVRSLEGCSFAPKERFQIELNLFDENAIDPVSDALQRMAAQGLGPGRGAARLMHREQQRLDIALDTEQTPLHRAALMFLTPTEIKGNNGQLLPAPDFAVLLARIRDRIGALRTLYGEGPLEMDHRAFAERAAHVRMRASELQQVNVDRFSTRTGQRHPLGGFIGTATYEGDLQEFAPYLHAASFTGVGRQTVWGKGEIALRRL